MTLTQTETKECRPYNIVYIFVSVGLTKGDHTRKICLRLASEYRLDYLGRVKWQCKSLT